jgi:hypothetical protein
MKEDDGTGSVVFGRDVQIPELGGIRTVEVS